MSSPHFLGNFKSPVPLLAKAIGPARQIAHYSCFPGATNEYGYQSHEALRLFQPPCVPFSFIKAPDKPTFHKMCDYLDSLPQQGLEPVVTACQRAGCADDLLEAEIITRRGVMSKYVCSLLSPTCALTWFNPAYHWVKKTCTTFPLWRGSCISSGEPSTCERKFYTGSFY